MDVVNNYYDQPGCCAVCSGIITPVIDTHRDRDIDGWTQSGRMYVCFGCVQSMGDMFGFASPEKVERLEAELAEAQRAHAEAEELLENALAALDALGTVRARKRVTKKAAPKMRRPDNDEAVA